MIVKLTRRNFLELGLAAMLSACARKVARVAPTATPTQPPTAATITPTAVPTRQVYEADNANILYTGRIDFTDPKKPKFSAPGVYVQARFRGTAVAVMLEDAFMRSSSRNYFDVLVDNKLGKLSPEKALTRYEIASNLPDGEHTITFVKRTEASVGSASFLGFEFLGEMLPPPARPERRMEFIGDSITCGAGDEAEVNSPQCQEDGWGQPYHNARVAYGAVLARRFNAAYHLSSVSGIGMVRNYSFQYDARPMPEVYDSVFFEQTASPAWDHTRFIPDAVVVALGTNDFSPGDSQRETMNVDVFVEAYVKFVNKLRAYYPDAHIFCISSPMLGDGWPTPGDKSATNQWTAINKVVDAFNGQGDARVHKFYSSKIVGLGCGTHPSAAQHALMADQLGASMAPVMNWTLSG